VYQQVPELEQRLSELQAQIDRLSLSLHLWRQTQDHLQPMERRLSQLTDQCAEILDSWTVTGERHAQAVSELEARLSEWNGAQERLQQDASQRIQNLERIIEHEWTELRQIHEQPARELRAQAASLAEVSVAAAQSAQVGLERAEARLAAIEGELHRRMSDLARDVHTAMADIQTRSDGQAWPPPSGATTWPLDGVMRLHDQLRQGSEADAAVEAKPRRLKEVDIAALDAELPTTRPPEPPQDHPLPFSRETTPGMLDAAPADLSERMDSLERAVTDGQNELRETAARTERITRAWRWAAGVLAVGTLVAGGLAWQSEREARAAAARVGEAQQQARLAREAANQQIAATREEASQQIAQARDTAARAQTIGNVLAAPDLVRYNLAGHDTAPPMSAQLLWSRSRGLVFSGSRLPAPPANSTYQIWLLTNGEPVSASTFVPDSSGRVTVALDTPPRVARPVVGVNVTLEPSGGSASPSGETLLARAP
jgi:hypothetical protein